jgi:hypothetical protein
MAHLARQTKTFENKLISRLKLPGQKLTPEKKLGETFEEVKLSKQETYYIKTCYKQALFLPGLDGFQKPMELK